jgi:hypothetical protein
MKNVYILGGGTVNHVRNHLALCAPAFGGTARKLNELMLDSLQFLENGEAADYKVLMNLTKMANHHSDMITNDDVSKFVDYIIADKKAKIVFFNVALCDYTGKMENSAIESGKHAKRLRTAEGPQFMKITPAEKLISRIRKERKDIFLVAFKTTTGADEGEQYLAGLNLLKANSVNLVLANDTLNRRNMIIVPEESRYEVTTDRDKVLQTLVDMTIARSRLHFTRSTVVPGDAVSWNSDSVPENLRTVVNHCISKGAYKPFRGSTAGHFAVKLNDTQFLTSKRKVNYNNLDKVGMVLVESTGRDNVVAHGAKPSVGGMSQRIIFEQHKGYDCIVHFHCPPLPEAKVSTRTQQWLECGSHECGANTSEGLKQVDEGIKVVNLDNHGPNIVFRKDVPAERVIAFIERTFDLSAKTGGLVA